MKPCKKGQSPCFECPYRKDALPGYLGGNDNIEYSEPIVQDIRVACHKTMGLTTEHYCTGLAMVRVNSCKSAKVDPVIVQSEENVRDSIHRKLCFKFKHEFDTHHKSIFARWEG